MGLEYEESGGKISDWNEAMFKMLRIHQLQSRINDANLNLLGFFPEENLYGFQIKIRSLKSLFSECYGKLNKTLQEEGTNKIRAIERFMEKNPVCIKKNNQVTHQETIFVDKNVWRIIEPILFEFELLIKVYLERTGLSGKNTEEDMF